MKIPVKVYEEVTSFRVIDILMLAREQGGFVKTIGNQVYLVTTI